MQWNLWNIRNNLFLSRNECTVRVLVLSHCMNRFDVALRPFYIV